MALLTVYCAYRLVEACCLVFCGRDTYGLPPALGCLRVFDPNVPKDLRLFYKLDDLGG
jgi:hypothetical protein